jgi:hypothetical protein
MRQSAKIFAVFLLAAVAAGGAEQVWTTGRGGLTDAATAQPATQPPSPNVMSPNELFAPIATVLNHPRCMNCHPRDERPRQGDDRHVHQQNVVRGPDDLGYVNMRCDSCHRAENNQYSGVPGAPTWHLAPIGMGWQGLDTATLCTTLKDKSRNGNRDVAALVEHMAHDKLVLWGWDPGKGREPVTTPHATFVAQLKAWELAGAPCPG